MIVLISLCFWGVFSFFIPKKNLKQYLILASFGIAAVYFCFEPPSDYDLYRHYNLLHSIKDYSLFEILIPKDNYQVALLESYSSNAKVYLIFAFIMAKIPIDNLLPVIAGFVIYGLISLRIIDFGNNEFTEKWKLALCFCFILCCADFRSVSGIRNMLAYAIFAYVLYEDLVKKRNRIVCFLIYFLLAYVHSTIIVLIVLRVLVELCKMVSIWVVGAVTLAAYTMLDVIVQILQWGAGNNLVTVLLSQIIKYSSGNITDYNMQRVLFRGCIMIVYLLIYLFVKLYMKMPEKYNDYGNFFLLTFLFTMGSISQYDIFIRNDLILLFLIVPFLLYFYQHFAGNNIFKIRVRQENKTYGVLGTILYFLSFIIMLFSLIYYVRYFYIPMDNYFDI